MATDKITLTLPDGSEREYQPGVTGLEVAESISKGLARAALSITVDGEILDLDRPITSDAPIAINTWDSEDGKYTFWHSSAHLLAEAVQELYPEAKFGIGPPIENGFYYDIDFGDDQITQDDLAKIEDAFINKARDKNSFERREKGEIKITLMKNGKDEVLLTICDDGVGMPNINKSDVNDSLGMTLIKTLAKQLGAEFDYHNGTGVKFEFKFNIDKETD